MNRRRFLAISSAAAAAGVVARLGAAPPPAVADDQPIYFDADGLIVHRGNDGGDTAQREGWYWFGVWIRENFLHDPWTTPRALTFPQVLRLLEPNRDGVFYRHPKLPPWNNPHAKDYGFSRDQMTPLVAAMGVWGATEELRRLWNALPQDPIGGTRHTFNGSWIEVFGQKVAHQGDIVGPMTINLFRRAWSEDPMTAPDNNGQGGELELLANVGVRLAAAAKDMDDTGDDLNLIVMLIMSMLRFPTDLARQAVKHYKDERPLSYGSYLGAYRRAYGVDTSVPPGQIIDRMNAGIHAMPPKVPWVPDSKAAYGAVLWYHRAEVGANPLLAKLYAPIIRHFLD
jgi:hypothetical protein